MAFTNFQLLLIIAAIFYPAVGLLLPLFYTEMMINGAYKFAIGLMYSLINVTSYVSKDLLALFVVGRKSEIQISLWCSFIIFFTMVFYQDLWTMCLLRTFYGLTVRLQYSFKEYVLKTGKDTNIFSIIKICGIIIGGLFGPHIYQLTYDSSSIAMITSCCVLLCILLLQYVDDDEPDAESNLESVPIVCFFRLMQLKNLDFDEKLEDVILKAAYSSSIAAYFSMVIFLLTFNYHIDVIQCGYMVGLYISFPPLCYFLAAFIRLRSFDDGSLFNHSMIAYTTTFVALYYAPNFGCHIFFLLIFISISSLISFLLEDNVLQLNLLHPGAMEASDTLDYLAKFFTPPLCGLAADLFGGEVFKIVSIVPAVICFILTHRDNLRLLDVMLEQDDFLEERSNATSEETEQLFENLEERDSND